MLKKVVGTAMSQNPAKTQIRVFDGTHVILFELTTPLPALGNMTLFAVRVRLVHVTSSFFGVALPAS